MTVTPGFTAEELAGFVREYEAQPYGQKGSWLAAQPFTRDQMRRWRRAYFDGDLDKGLVPRQCSSGAGVLARAKAAEEELDRVREQTRQELADLRASHQVELADRDAQIKMLEAGNVTLGKAIGLLQNLS